MKQRHVLVVGGLDHTLDKLEKLGIRYSIMQIPQRVTDKQLRNASRLVVMNYEDMDEVMLIARAWHSRDPFDAVISFTEYGLHPASQCAIELGIPGNNLEAVLLTRDKIKMRDLLDRHGLSPVRYRVCETVDDARHFFRELGGEPMVLKPFAGGLSEGVFFVDAEDHLAERWGWTRETTNGPVLAEEFLSGPEFSVESISINGKHEIAMITEKITTELPRFIELGHQVPARLDAPTQSRIKELVIGFLNLIGQGTAPAHTEIRLTQSGPKIIESQTRIGGDQIWEMCEMVSGVDLMSETVAALTDLPRPKRTPIARAAAIRFFSCENARILDVRNVDAAEKAPGVVRVKCLFKAGQTCGNLTSSDSRQGYVLCTGNSIDEAMMNADTARDAVKVDWEPVAATPASAVRTVR
jgi:biotin carboxylase